MAVKIDRGFFASMRGELIDALNQLDSVRRRDESLRQKISRLSDVGKIPRTTAQFLHLLLTARNEAEYEGKIYEGIEAEQLAGAWVSVRKWAADAGLLPGGTAEPQSSVPAAKPCTDPATPRRGPYRCPIPGCKMVFRVGRLGWDAHVASWRLHKDWHPDVIDSEERKERFRHEFTDWF